MTTKYKIIFGFVSMMVIIAVISMLGYRTLDGSVAGYDEFRRYARLNVQTSDAMAAFNAAGIRMNMFLAGYNDAFVKTAQDAMDEVDACLAATVREIKNPRHLEIAEAIRKQARAYREGQGAIGAACRRMMEVFRTRVLPNRAAVEAMTISMMNTARLNKNEEMLFLLSQSGIEGAALRFAMANLIHTRSEEHGKAAVTHITAALSTVERMKGVIRSQQGQEDHARLAAAFQAWAEGITSMIEAAGNANTALAAIRALRDSLDKDFTALSAEFDKQMRAFGPATKEAMVDGQKMLLAGSAVGILVGLALAVYISLLLVRVLADVTAYITHIARGDFSYRLKRRMGRGEFGNMALAVQGIPDMLEKLVAEARKTADNIRVGDFRFRPDASAFPGAYNDLVLSINTVCDAYTDTLDQLPVALYSAGFDHKMTYLNNLTQAVLGGDKTGQRCFDCFKSPICNTDKCFANIIKQSGRQSAGEADIFPGPGQGMALAVTAIPLHDKDGLLRGYLEACTDISAIKEQQRSMIRVAEQAKAISDRVAASSEELSAQVEQASQGAEQQRVRVEGTVTAMTQMNSTVLEVARSAGQASEQSEATRDKANEGAVLVDKVVEAINLVNRVAATLQANMRELGGQAENIGGVMNVISDIADQTNLLALNAAIEAARAGDAGRGFAVVADEVRKLAEKTMAATQEVGTNIAAIQNSARTNIHEVGEAAKAVTEATDLANTSGRALAEIVSLASVNSTVVASIATAAEEQSATSEEINQSIEVINKIAGETASGMHQSSKALHELARMAQELHRVMEELR